MTNPRRNPGYVSRRGDDRRILQVLPTEPGRWDIFWADGASVSLIAPSEDVARLRAQLRRDEHERSLAAADTLWHRPISAPTPEVTPPFPSFVGPADHPPRLERPAPRTLPPEPSVRLERTLRPPPAPPPRRMGRWLIAAVVAGTLPLLLLGGLIGALVLAWISR